MALLLQNGDSHVEMMVFHGGGGVDGCQWAPNINHELVVETSMVQVVADCANKH